MMPRKIKFSLFFLSLFIFNLNGQNSILENYVKEALGKNLNVQNEFLKKEKQTSKIDQTRRLWKPTVNLEASYLFANGGRELIFPIGDLFNPVYGTLNALTQSSDFPTDLPNEEIQLTPNNFLDLQLRASKPLLNSSIKYNQLIQKELLRINDLDIELNKSDVAMQIRSGYYNYMKTFEGLKILGETEKLLKDVLAFNKKLVKYDKATSDILSDVEFQLANINSQRAMILEQQELAKAYFNLLLNKPLNSEVLIDENILLGNLTQPENIKSLFSKAKQTRLEFKKLEVASAVNTLNQKRIDKEKSPTLAAFGGVGLQTEAFNFDSGGPLMTIGLSMNWNILDGGMRKSKIDEINIDQRILENDRRRLNQQVEIQITQIFYKLRSLEMRMQSEEVAVRSAKKSYDVIKTRYENDKALLIQLIQAQNSLTTSELNRALTKYDYLIQLAELRKVIGE